MWNAYQRGDWFIQTFDVEFIIKVITIKIYVGAATTCSAVCPSIESDATEGYILLSVLSDMLVEEVVGVYWFCKTKRNAYADDVFSGVPRYSVAWRPCSWWWMFCWHNISVLMRDRNSRSCFLNICHNDVFQCCVCNVTECHAENKCTGRIHLMNREIKIWSVCKAGSRICLIGNLIWRNTDCCRECQAKTMLPFCMTNGYRSELSDTRLIILASLIDASCSVGGQILLYGVRLYMRNCKNLFWGYVAEKPRPEIPCNETSERRLGGSGNCQRLV